ncbi:MAG: UDP-glucose 4-epimerase GalE, partial [Thiomicrospira sp.]|nr:UDP-glucose 4-epimerase GalE [Thiomicrospira sp.]
IGSHACVELLAAGYDLVVLDNLSNSSTDSLRRVCGMLDFEFLIFNEQASSPSAQNDNRLTFIEGDIRDRGLLRSVFSRFEIEAVIHFAGLKAVGESVAMPLRYYDNNVSGSVALFEVMAEFGCKRLVFSSSATVYGDPASVPIKEDFPLSTTNPYGASKLMVENILRDVFASDADWSIGLLRYFNPVGAHESGLIGEDPTGIPNNLMPFVSQVAVGQRAKLSVFGGDYATVDGTGVRDYIHVVDLAKGHVKTLEKLKKQPGLVTLNLGTGRGYSVLEVVKAFEQASGKAVPYEIVARRPGDVVQCYADPAYALEVLDWKAELGIDRMCEDAWRWQSQNPKGYKE